VDPTDGSQTFHPCSERSKAQTNAAHAANTNPANRGSMNHGSSIMPDASAPAETPSDSQGSATDRPRPPKQILTPKHVSVEFFSKQKDRQKRLLQKINVHLCSCRLSFSDAEFRRCTFVSAGDDIRMGERLSNPTECDQHETVREKEAG
jgi:hypothetical protein